MKQRYPFFAEQFAAEKVDARSGQYLEGMVDGDAERERILAAEHEYREYMPANVGRLFVYG